MLFRKKIGKVKVLGNYKIDVDDLLSKNDKSIKLIAESNKYLFYDYYNPKESYNHFILRQDKVKRKDVVSFGWFNTTYDLFCFFDKYLIMAKRGIAEFGHGDKFVFIDEESGERKEHAFRSPYGHIKAIGGYGRHYSQDSVNNMYVQDGKLIIEFSREEYKGTDADKAPLNKNMNFQKIIEKNE